MKMTRKQAKKVLESNGYKEATSEDFWREEQHITSVDQVYVCTLNLLKFRPTNQGKFYFINGSPVMQVRVWETF